MRLVISLCNIPEGSKYRLLTLDTETNAITPLPLELEPRLSVTGMTLHGNDLLVAFTTRGISHLAFLDARTLELKARTPLHNVRDAHSIAVRDEELYIVSTGADAVLRYSVNGRDIRFAGTLWAPTSGIDDSMHINGITAAEGRLLCSGFGTRAEDRWSSARDGFVFDLDANQTVMSHLYHPHSVTVRDNQVYCLESVTGHLVGKKRTVWSVDGYARGLCFLSADRAAVGTSVARQSNAGRFQNSADPGEPIGTCGITFIEMKTGARTMIALGAYNNEVYDVIVLPE